MSIYREKDSTKKYFSISQTLFLLTPSKPLFIRLFSFVLFRTRNIIVLSGKTVGLKVFIIPREGWHCTKYKVKVRGTRETLYKTAYEN